MVIEHQELSLTLIKPKTDTFMPSIENSKIFLDSKGCFTNTKDVISIISWQNINTLKYTCGQNVCCGTMTELLNRDREVTVPCLIPFFTGIEGVSSTVAGEMVTLTLACSFLYISRVDLMTEILTPQL